MTDDHQDHTPHPNTAEPADASQSTVQSPAQPTIRRRPRVGTIAIGAIVLAVAILTLAQFFWSLSIDPLLFTLWGTLGLGLLLVIGGLSSSLRGR